MTNEYLKTVSLVERLHRQFLDVVKRELECSDIRDINSVQAMMLFHLGNTEPTVGELTLRGGYLGSTVSYNLKKLVEKSYVEQARSPHDRRSIHVRLTLKGRALCDRLTATHLRHAESLSKWGMAAADLEQAARTLRGLEHFWIGIRDDAHSEQCSTLSESRFPIWISPK